MKNLKKVLLVLMIGLIAFPLSIKADEKSYKTLNLDEALTEEEIEHDFSNYSENDDQMTIYLFRGKGCGYCKKFLTFLNSIVDEYGKYFKLESYEVWYNEDNAELMQGVSKYMNEDASGVPFIIIGDKVFSGYSESYDDEIKAKIKEEYDKDKKDRVNKIEEYKKNGNKDEKKDEDESGMFSVVVFSVLFTAICTSAVSIYFVKKTNVLEERIEKLETKKGNK